MTVFRKIVSIVPLIERWIFMNCFQKQLAILAMTSVFALSACSTTNDLNPRTGSATGAVAGGVLGATAAYVLSLPKAAVALAGIGGAGVGYYLTTLRFSARGIYAAGGQVYTLGDYIIINIPTDNMFDANTADFLTQAKPALQSIRDVLARYPDHNIIISGNTSGFWTSRFELSMSVCRAEQVASYLSRHGIGNSAAKSPKYMYVGYGDKFPIANLLHIKSIRQNSRIQIVAYPDTAKLYWNKSCKKHFKPYPGRVEHIKEIEQQQEIDRTFAVKDDSIPVVETNSNVAFNGEVEGEIPETESLEEPTNISGLYHT